MGLTEEQFAVVNAVLDTSSDKIITVNSIAGSGKTSTAEAVIRAFKPINGIYFAFNKSAQLDADARFNKDSRNKLIECNTIHAFARRVLNVPANTIEEFSYSSIKEKLSYDNKKEIITTLDDFYRSNSINIYEYVDEHCTNDMIKDLICKYAELMLADKVKPTFNFLLKWLHIKLATGELAISKDLVILDECQDTTAVALEIIKLIKAKKKVLLGDKFQNIYSFMNTVNAFELLEDTDEYRLTQSFRCTGAIAGIVDEFGKKYLSTDFIYDGTEGIQEENGTITYLSRSNAYLIKRMLELTNKGINFCLERPVDSIFSLPKAMYQAAQGYMVEEKKYGFLAKEYKNFKKSKYADYYTYISNIIDTPDIVSTANILKDFEKKDIDLEDLYKKVKYMTPNRNIVLSTVHAFKGLESDYIVLEDDLNRSVNSAIKAFLDAKGTIEERREQLTKDQKENLNIYYVALSRARIGINNVNYKR